jgi:hypothetical protein
MADPERYGLTTCLLCGTALTADNRFICGGFLARKTLRAFPRLENTG